MARLTWQEVSNPNFSGANSAFGMMGEMLSKATQPIVSGIESQQEAMKQRASNEVMQRALAYQDPAAMREALASGSLFQGIDPRYTSEAAMEMVQGQRGSLLGERQKEATIRGTDASTDQTRTQTAGMGIENNRANWTFGNEQSAYAAKQAAAPIIAQIDELGRQNRRGEAEALARQNAGLFQQAGMDPLEGIQRSNTGVTSGQDNLTADRTFVDTVSGWQAKDGGKKLGEALLRDGNLTIEQANQRLQDARTNKSVPLGAIEEAQKYISERASMIGSQNAPLADVLLAEGIVPTSITRTPTDNTWASDALGAAASQAAPVARGTVPQGQRASLINNGIQAAGATRVTPDLLNRVIGQESSWNTEAVSPKGASGLGQSMPDTARDPGFNVRPLKNPADPQEQVRFSAEYLDAMIGRYNGDIPRALAAYNWGAGNADNWDGNLNSLPAETRNYVLSITGGEPTAEFAAQAGNQTPAMQALTQAAFEASPSGSVDSPTSNQTGGMNAVDAMARSLDVGNTAPLVEAPVAQRGAAPIRTTSSIDQAPSMAEQALAAAAVQNSAIGEPQRGTDVPMPQAVTPAEANAAALQRAGAPSWFDGTADEASMLRATQRQDQTITEDNSAYTRGQRTRQNDDARANEIRRIVTDQQTSPAFNAMGNVLGSTVDFFAASPREAEANAQSREQAGRVREFWNSAAPQQYMANNPDEVPFIRANPEGFAQHMISQMATAQTGQPAPAAAVETPTQDAGTDRNDPNQRGEAPSPAGERGAAIVPEGTPDPATTQASRVAQQMAQANARVVTDAVNNAIDVGAAVGEAERLLTMDDANNNLSDLEAAFLNPTGPSNLTDASKEVKDTYFADSSNVTRDGVARLITKIQDELPGTVTVPMAVALMKHISVEEPGAISAFFGANGQIDVSKAKAVWGNFMQELETPAGDGAFVSITPGMTRLDVATQKQSMRSKLANIRTKMATAQSQLAGLSGTDAAAARQNYMQLDAHFRKQILDILGNGRPYTDGISAR